MLRRVTPPPASPAGLRSKSGQALLESFGVIILLCLILFGSVQYVLLLTATEIIQYSADASARARAVGFNPFMVYKVNRVSSIANAGPMTRPASYVIGNSAAWTRRSENGAQPPERAFFSAVRSSPGSSQYNQTESENIPYFLGSRNQSEMYGYLDYEDWETISPPLYSIASSGNIEVTVSQEFALRMPLFRAFTNDDEIQITKQSSLVDHSELYLE